MLSWLFLWAQQTSRKSPCSEATRPPLRHYWKWHEKATFVLKAHHILAMPWPHPISDAKEVTYGKDHSEESRRSEYGKNATPS